MAASMPAIGTREGGTAEIVMENENGFLYQSGSALELADYMCRLIEHPDLIEEYGKNAKEHVVQNYTIRKNTDEVYKVIRQLVQEKV